MYTRKSHVLYNKLLKAAETKEYGEVLERRSYL
jgi:hypothetical protein